MSAVAARENANLAGCSPGMRRAGRLAAIAVLRVGAGLFTLVADGEPEDPLDDPDSVMTRSLPAGGEFVALLAGKAGS